MLSFLVFGIGGFVLGVIVYLRLCKVDYGRIDWNDIGPSLGVGCLTMFFACLLVMLPVGMLVDPKYEKEIRTIEVTALEDNSATSGSFFFGCGSIDGTMKYVFYMKTGEGEYEMGMMNYRGVKIRYENTTPRIERTYGISTNKWSIREHNKVLKTVIVVPKGTIKQNYNLDAK